MGKIEKLNAFVSWSGGKDSALAYWRAAKDFNMICLLNMVNEDGLRSRSHGIRADVLQAQGEAIGLPLIQVKSSWKTYEAEFKKTLFDLNNKGVEAGVFGDIDLEEHREWVERVSRGSGLKAVLPLWQEKREDLLREFIDVGFEAVIVAARKQWLGPEWLGRRITPNFIREISQIREIDICGEKGEFHTLVVDGPIFRKKIGIREAKVISRKEIFFLEILDLVLEEKGGASVGSR